VTRADARRDHAGLIACLKDGDLGVAYHIGFDREASGDLPVYLRLLHAAVDA